MIEVRSVKKRYGTKQAVDGVSFDVKKGEIFGILGPNGAGKTTTLEMMESMRPIDSGEVHINGVNVKDHPWKIKNIIGIQPQEAAFMEKAKLTEHLEQLASAYGVRVDTKKLLSEVDLTDKANSYAEDLSGGQRQRFSIVASMVHDPVVFFMDEPTTGLDPQARRNLWDLIRTIRDKGVTIVITTHYMEEAELLCDRVAIMDNGKIIAIDSPKKLVKALLGRGFTKPQHVEQASLEDVFIDLTGKELRD